MFYGIGFFFVKFLISNVLLKRLISRKFARNHSMVYKYANPERFFVRYFPINKKSILSILMCRQSVFSRLFPKY